MTVRLIDLMCDQHRAEALTERRWPDGFMFCLNCGTTSVQPACMPGVDLARENPLHEAAHAIAFLHAGIGVRAVTCQSTRAGLAGHTHIDDHDMTTHGALVGLWAGQSATLHLLHTLGALDDAAIVDATRLSRSDTDLVGRAAPAAVREARTVADLFVAAHWPRIEAVADALLERGELTGADVQAITGGLVLAA